MNTHNQADQNRLLISTFIVATAVATYFSDIKLPIHVGSLEFYIIGVIYLSIIASAGLSFLYILARGHELRHNHTGRRDFIDRHSHRLYDWSIASYPWVIGILGFIFTHNHLKNLPDVGQFWSTLFGYTVATIVTILVCRKPIIEIYGLIRKQAS